MFKQVYIVQCKSTGEFLTPKMNYARRFGNAGFFMDYQSAVDTGLNEFDADFEVFTFYKKESELPIY